MKIHFIPALAVAALSAIAAPSHAGAPPLQGFWMTDIKFERPSGEVEVARSDGKWTATFNGETATETGTDRRSWAAQFTKQNVSLRLHDQTTASEPRGFWIQQGDQGQALASPLRFTKKSAHKWSAQTTNLDLKFTLYAHIFNREDGVLIVSFRNPQRNTRGGGQRLYVQQSGNKVLFLDNNEGKPGITHEAALSADGQQLSLNWPEIGSPLSLKRVGETPPDGYYPRTPSNSKYQYRVPDEIADGWKTGTVSSVGFETQKIEDAVQKILNTDPSSRRPDLIHALLVARGGRLVLEEYFYGQTRETIHDERSAGKTFSSVMTGILIDRKKFQNADTKLIPILQPHFEIKDPSEQRSRISLAHLMTHRSGLDCDDTNQDSPGNEDVMQSGTETDWWKYAANLSMKAEPGTRYAYCSAGINLVGAALTFNSAKWLPFLFHDEVAEPLAFGDYAWNLAPNGEGYMGGGVRLRARDLLKLGQLYLSKGKWNGKQLVSEGWVRESTSAKVVINEQSTGLSSDALKNTYPGGADGYAWHLFQIKVGDKSYQSYEASGNGGQMVVVVPELDLTVAMNGGNYNQGFIWGRWRDEIIGNLIIAALSNPER